jgi:hypothetical protein
MTVLLMFKIELRHIEKYNVVGNSRRVPHVDDFLKLAG